MAKSPDFKQDTAALDDVAPIPVAPMPELPTVEEDQAQDETEDAKLAQAYWHPAWSKVQEKFQEVLDRYGSKDNALAYKDLPADEFKIKMIAEATVKQEWEKIMEDVKRAVESFESRPKPAKRSKSGS